MSYAQKKKIKYAYIDLDGNIVTGERSPERDEEETNRSTMLQHDLKSPQQEEANLLSQFNQVQASGGAVENVVNYQDSQQVNNSNTRSTAFATEQESALNAKKIGAFFNKAKDGIASIFDQKDNN